MRGRSSNKKGREQKDNKGLFIKEMSGQNRKKLTPSLDTKCPHSLCPCNVNTT